MSERMRWLAGLALIVGAAALWSYSSDYLVMSYQRWVVYPVLVGLVGLAVLIVARRL